MIEAYVGPEAFRQGVASYLKKYSYGNAAGEDFWNEMARVTGQAGRSDHAELRRSAGRAGAVGAQHVRRRRPATSRVTQARFIGAPGRGPPAPPQTWTLPGLLQDRRPGQPRCEVIERADADVHGCRAATAVVRQRRQPRLLLHRVHARGACARSATAHAPLTPRRAPQPARRRVVDGARRPPRHRRLPRSGGGAGQRRHAGGARRRSPAAWRYRRATSPTPAEQRALQALDPRAFAPGAGGARPARARRATPTTPEPARDAAAAGRRRGDDADVQRAGARAGARATSPTRRRCRRRWRRPVLQVAALGGDARALRQYRRAAAKPRAHSRRSTTASSTRSAWFRDPALVQRTLEFALSPSRALAGHRHADRRRCSRAPGRATRPGRSSRRSGRR